MRYEDWAILRHFQILLLLVCAAKQQHFFFFFWSKKCGLASPTYPWAKSDWQLQSHLDSPRRGKMLLENSFKSLKLPVRLDLSGLVYHRAAGHPLWGSLSFWATMLGRLWEMSVDFILKKSHMPWGRQPPEKQKVWRYWAWDGEKNRKEGKRKEKGRR